MTILKKRTKEEKQKQKKDLPEMKIFWVYCIIVRSSSIDFRKREKRCTSISLEWTERTLPADTDSAAAFKKADGEMKMLVLMFEIVRDSAGWNAQHNHHWECSVT